MRKTLLTNAKRLAEGLKNEGITLVSGGTDNHLLLVRPTRVRFNWKSS